MCVVVQVSFKLVHGVQPSMPEFHKHLLFLLRQRSQAWDRSICGFFVVVQMS
jgi:hypothetical protein